MRISHIAVVIPARNEEALIGRCLASVIAAATPHTSITVVADACTDATAEVARSFAGVRVLEVDSAAVGRARSAGVTSAIAEASGATSTLWIANTDADSVVPTNWISEQVRLADRGADLLIGTVSPDFADLTPRQVAAWLSRFDPERPNGHVHGANLGLRASVYAAAGGFAPLGEHEDVDLVVRCGSVGARVEASNSFDVMTSGRAVGRTGGGYARYLQTELLVDL
jgi:glycosyltransferase involved in cell wall biosynthesis